MAELKEEQIVIETIKYYKNHNRGIGRYNGCEYLTEDKCMCALGRAMTNDALLNYGKYANDADTLFNNIWLEDEPNNPMNHNQPPANKEVYDQKLFKEEYKGHTREFWTWLQSFHDNHGHWIKYKTKDGNKISTNGKKFVKNRYHNIDLKSL